MLAKRENRWVICDGSEIIRAATPQEIELERGVTLDAEGHALSPTDSFDDERLRFLHFREEEYKQRLRQIQKIRREILDQKSWLQKSLASIKKLFY